MVKGTEVIMVRLGTHMISLHKGMRIFVTYRTVANNLF